MKHWNVYEINWARNSFFFKWLQATILHIPAGGCGGLIRLKAWGFLVYGIGEGSTTWSKYGDGRSVWVNSTETMTPVGHLWGQVVEMLEGVRKLSIGRLKASVVRYRSWDKVSCFVLKHGKNEHFRVYCWIIKRTSWPPGSEAEGFFNLPTAPEMKSKFKFEALLLSHVPRIVLPSMSSWRLWTRMLLVLHFKGWVGAQLAPLARVLWAAMPWIYQKKPQRTSWNVNVVSMSVLQKQAKPQLMFVNFPCKHVLGFSGDFWDTAPENQTSECFKKYRSSLDASLFDPSRPLQDGDSVVPAEHLEDAKRQSEEPPTVVSNTVLALLWEFTLRFTWEVLCRRVRQVHEVGETTNDCTIQSGERLPGDLFLTLMGWCCFWRRLPQNAVA